MMEKIKLICVDLDGTLLLDDHATVSPGNLAAIREASVRGIHVAPTTGRILGRIPKGILEVPGLDYAILANGAQVCDLKTGGFLYENGLSLELTLEMLDLAWSQRLLPEVYQGNHMRVQWGDRDLIAHQPVDREHLDALLAEEERIGDLKAFLIANPGGIVKFNIPCIEPESRRQAARQLFEATRKVAVASSMERNIELNAPGVNKATGIAALCAHLGIGRENVMALGDGDNDRDMLSWAGLSVAMGNAPPDIQSLAHRVTATNLNDGVAQAIRWVL